MALIFFGGLWLSSQFSAKKDLKQIEVLSFSQFSRMLSKSGKKEIGVIYTQAPKQGKSTNPILSMLGREQGFVLEISPRQITGRYLRAGNRIEPTDTHERILDRTIPFIVESLPGVISEKFLQKLEANGVVYQFMNEEEGGFFSTFFSLLPILLIVFLLWMVMMRQIQHTGNRALAFGKSRAQLNESEDKKKITFKDVAGCEEAKQELSELVDFLSDPRKFHTIGAKIPRRRSACGTAWHRQDSSCSCSSWGGKHAFLFYFRLRFRGDVCRCRSISSAGLI